MCRVQMGAALVLGLVSVNAAGFEFALGADSRYVSEGRNNLEHGGIQWLEGSQDLASGLVVSGAYGSALSSTQEYDELNLGLGYEFALADWALGLGYTRLEMFEDEESDNEFSLGVAWEGHPWLVPSLELVYSTEAAGSFVELGLSSEWALGANWVLAPYLVVGLDYGYADEVHRGYNHTAIGTELAWQFSPRLGLNMVLEHQQLSDSVELVDESEYGQSWVGAHLVMRF